MKILIAEDEQDLREALQEGLRLEGYAVDSAENGAEAEQMVFGGGYDLLLLDLNLPGMDGMEVLRQVRGYNKELNILILSARSALTDKVDGLDLGANDYLTKPFHFAELLARVRSMLRRRTIQESALLRSGPLVLDTASRTVTVYDAPVPLTSKETALLEYFLLNQGRVIGPQELLEHIWDSQTDEFSNSVRVHISSLRKKLRGPLGADPIRNKIGEGYFWEERP